MLRQEHLAGAGVGAHDDFASAYDDALIAGLDLAQKILQMRGPVLGIRKAVRPWLRTNPIGLEVP